MNRSKLFIGIFIAFLLIVITVVLLVCTVFVVREVVIEKEVNSALIDDDNIIESSGLSIGKSIISINKDKVKASVEKENPYVEVLNITRVFPNKIIINVTVRTGIMVVSSADGSYKALVDSGMKVLNVLPADSTLSVDATIVSGADFLIPENGAESLVGSILTLSDTSYDAIFTQFADFIESFDLEGKSFTTLFKEISFRNTESGTLVLIRTNKGVSLVLDTSLTSSIKYQLYACMYYYTTDKEVNIDRTKGYIAFDRTRNSYNWLESLD